MRVLPGPTKSNTALAWSPDSRFLAAGGSGDGVMVWEVDAGTPGERVLKSGHGGQLLQFCPRTGRLHVAFKTGGLCHHDPSTGEENPGVRDYASFYGMAASPDGRLVALHCYNVRRPANRARSVIGLAVADDGTLTEAWSRPENRWADVFTFRGGTGELFGLGHPLTGANKRFEWREAGSRDVAGSLKPPRGCRVDRWALAPDGGRVAWLHEHALYAQRLTDPEPRRLPAGGEYRRGLAFHPSGRILACTSGKTVRLLDAETLGEIRALDWGLGNARAVAFSPDGLRCAVSGEAGRGWVTVFDLE
jgi:WD40 repeat protein